MDAENLTEDLLAMEMLQKEVPVLFRLSGLGKHGNILVSIIHTMMEKANAPFCDPSPSPPSSEKHLSCPELAYFPCLSTVRQRGSYSSDKANYKQKEKLCTKQSHGHPSLLPGIFTLYCQHGQTAVQSIHQYTAMSFCCLCHFTGICHGFQVMRKHESPNTPFSVLLTRFPNGEYKLIVGMIAINGEDIYIVITPGLMLIYFVFSSRGGSLQQCM